MLTMILTALIDTPDTNDPLVKSKRDSIARAINNLSVTCRIVHLECRNQPATAPTLLYERVRLGCMSVSDFEHEGVPLHLPPVAVPTAQLSAMDLVHINTRHGSNLMRLEVMPITEAVFVDATRPEHTSRRVWCFLKEYVARAQHTVLRAHPCANAKCQRRISGKSREETCDGYVKLFTDKIVPGTDEPSDFFCSRHCCHVWTAEYDKLLPDWSTCKSEVQGPKRVESELRAALKRNSTVARALRVIERGGSSHLRSEVVHAVKLACNLDVALLHASSLLAPLKTSAAIAGLRPNWRKGAFLLKRGILSVRKIRMPTHVITELHTEERITKTLESRARTLF